MTIALVVLAIVAIPVAVWIATLVFMDYWTWFIVPLGVTNIGFAHALGLMFFISLLTRGLSKVEMKDDADKGDVVIAVVGDFAAVVFLWGVGWALHQFMGGG
jgi:hypothetical protein